jgi:MFS family permease
MSDLHGRKGFILVGTGLHLVAQLFLLISTSLNSFFIILIIIGFTAPVHMTIGFVYLLEVIPKKNRILIGSLLIFTSGCSAGLLPIYFLYISKEWTYISWFIFSTGIISIAILAIL